MRKIAGFLRLIRPVNCFMMGFAVIVGAALAVGIEVTSEWDKLVLGFITGFTLTGASMAINDYYDREIDVINEPERPIPSGIIGSNEALLYSLILAAIGILTASQTSISCLIVAIMALTVSISYATFGKRTGLLGNFLVSACVATPFIYGSFAVGNFNLAVFLFAAMAFLSNTGREITKGIVDVEGDKTKNIRTLAIRFGCKAAAFVAVLFYISAVILSPLPVIFELVSCWFIPFVIVTDFGLIISSIMLLKDPSRANAKRIKNFVLFCFMFGLLAFIAGSL